MKPAVNSSAETSPPAMPDVQGRADLREMPIQRVGIKSLRYPLILQVGGKLQPTVGTWTLDVALGAEQKGAHMSRLIAWLDALDRPLNAEALAQEIEALLVLLQAEAGRIEVHFPFFIRKAAPVTGLQSLMEYDGCWIAEAHGVSKAAEAEKESHSSNASIRARGILGKRRSQRQRGEQPARPRGPAHPHHQGRAGGAVGVRTGRRFLHPQSAKPAAEPGAHPADERDRAGVCRHARDDRDRLGGQRDHQRRS